MLSKKTTIITLSVLISVLAAILAVILIISAVKGASDEKLSFSSALSSDNLSSSFGSSSIEALVSEPEIEEIGLHISTPTSKTVSTTEKSFKFSGTSDPAYPLTVNGKEIERDENGIFSITEELAEGKNTFTFSHKGETAVYTINYRFVIIKSYNPSNAQTYSSGSTLSVSVEARKGSSVTASLNGETITLKEHIPQDESGEKSDVFATYKGSFKLPSNNKSNLDLGKITFKATYNGKSEIFSSGKITCKKPEIKVQYNSNAAPLGGKYINVGTGKITEIVAYEAETFDAYSTNDWSRPTNNYLPKGTVDYSAQGHIYYEGSVKKEYSLLRCGKQVYTTRKDASNNSDIVVVKEYAGTLPDHNEINISSFKNNGTHTVLTLDTLWKAPFYFDALPQSYENPAKQNYKISSYTCQYIDITLCYTTVFKGKIEVSENNPLFSKAEIIKNKSDYTIRLHLKKQGGFYGWDSNYNEKGQLVFEFLNPTYVEKADNDYGVDLKGARIFIDVGHGGKDPGALGFNGKSHNEAIQNLVLAKKIKAELEKIGAKVYMSRTSNDTVSNDKKIQKLKSIKPDFCVAVHHNSAYSSSANGFDSYYSHPFAKKAAELIYMHTKNTGIYKNYDLDWHYYFMARSSYCPVVLTENGFISNSFDYKNIISDGQNTVKAKAIVRGIAEYFLYISPDKPYQADTQEPETESSSSSQGSSSSSLSSTSSSSSESSSSSSSNPSESQGGSSGSSSENESSSPDSSLNSSENSGSSSDTLSSSSADSSSSETENNSSDTENSSSDSADDSSTENGNSSDSESESSDNSSSTDSSDNDKHPDENNPTSSKNTTTGS